jgi:outer membrane biosynthesis protein TonB
MFIILILLLQGGSEAIAQDTPSATGSIGCASHLNLPEYPALARAARIQGEATAFLTVAADGTALRVDVTPVHPILKTAVEEELRGSKFSPSCAGKVVEVVFAFVIEGSPVHGPVSRAFFTGPNKFTISTRPAMPMPQR